MGDVRNKSLLNEREILQSVDLILQACGHIVEGHGETCEIIFTAHLHALPQMPLGKLLSDAGG